MALHRGISDNPHDGNRLLFVRGGTNVYCYAVSNLWRTGEEKVMCSHVNGHGPTTELGSEWTRSFGPGPVEPQQLRSLSGRTGQVYEL